MSPALPLLQSAASPLAMPLYHSHLLQIGDSHLRDGRNCQDYAAARGVPEGVAFVVADGASNYIDNHGNKVPSSNEAGAIIVGEVALTTALEGIAAGLDPDALHQLVCTELAASLRHLWQVLGSRGQGFLGTTLLLGVVTPDWTRIWVSGDGAWGLHLPPSADLRDLRGPNLVIRTDRADATTVRGGCHTPKLRRTAAAAARKGAAAVADAFPVALGFDGPVIGAWVASDGLADEPELQQLMHRSPPRSKPALIAALRRPEYCDDLAVAWAVTPVAEVHDA